MDISVKEHVFFPWPLDRRQITVNQSSRYNRRKADARLEKQGEEVWRQRVTENPHLFNGTKFRYGGLSIKSGGLSTISGNNMKIVTPGEETDTSVVLKTGFSNYKDYTMTNMSHLAEEYVEQGLEHHGDTQACLADIIGHSALLLTADNYVVIQLRSMTVGEGAGLWHFPGGHPEPGEIGIKNTRDMENTDERKIVDEIYDSCLQEMKEELNLSKDMLSDPTLLSVLKDKKSFYKPEFNFILRSTLTSQQMSNQYHAVDFEEEESDDIGFWEVGKLDISNCRCFELVQYKEAERSSIVVNIEELAGSSVLLLQCLTDVLQYNPVLFH